MVLLPSRWIDSQQCYYLHVGSKKSGKRWLSSLIKKMWSVSWDMWRFRNGILHSQSITTPSNFTFLLSSMILTELHHGHRLLPPSCSYLFHTSHTSLLRGSVNSRKIWLVTVWSARDHYSPADTICQRRNAIVASFVVA